MIILSYPKHQDLWLPRLAQAVPLPVTLSGLKCKPDLLKTIISPAEARPDPEGFVVICAPDFLLLYIQCYLQGSEMIACRWLT
jgi:hypothetical protein